jgi:hypothetical protein
VRQPPEPNYDESALGEVVLPPLTLDGRPVTDEAGREACRRSWVAAFARDLYGPMPPPPDALTVRRLPLPGERAERLVLSLTCGGRLFQVDAALWLPERRKGPVPLIVGLDSIGPAGIMLTDGYPLDPDAIVSIPKLYGLEGGRLAEQVRGTYQHRWPVEAILAAGWGLLVSGYGSWTPDHPDGWKRHGVFPLLGLGDGPPTGALSLWAWALSRLIDVAEGLPEVDRGRIALVGHSRLGKAALWCAANDTRSSDVLLSSSGCGGLSPSRRNFGETLDIMASLFPHWLTFAGGIDPASMAVDQHQLAACVAPRRLYSATASDDLWADPRGTYLALRAAAPFWGIGRPMPRLPDVEAVWAPGRSATAGPLGWHLRPGGHEMLPYDWTRFLAFLATT